MAGLILGSEDDWQSELAEHPELASLQEASLFEEGALEEALANLADGADDGAAGAGSKGSSAGRRVGAGEPTLEELLAGAVDLTELGTGAVVPGGDAAEPGAAAAGDGARHAAERTAQEAVRAGAAFVRDRSAAREAAAHAGKQAVPLSNPEQKISKQRVFDLHCDTLDRLCLRHFAPQNMWTEQDADVPEADRSSLAHNACHLALDRMAPFAWCQCFAVFMPDEFRGDAAWRLFQHVSAYFQQQLESHADLVEQARDARSIDEILSAGKTAAVLTVEGAAFLEDPLFEESSSTCGIGCVAELAEAGVKMMTLTWNGPNAIGSGHDTRDGLTHFGREVVREMEEHRMVVDVSHLNDRGFSDLVEVATRPFAASHSNARSVCGHRRNLTDAQARIIFEGGGIVGLNYCRDFLREGSGDVTPDAVLRHVDRLLELGGERGLALGSDYDGTDVPTWLDGCERVGTLHELIERHFGHEIAERVFYENARDFFLRNDG